ncbi:MAG: glycine cleavage system protein H [Planctomycetales bacterium]|nr:glycine cleavage system protein H [Planctomycetales bacterium]
MSDPLVFMMGNFAAQFPTDRLYAKNHMWAQRQEQRNCFRCGFSAYAVRLLQDVYFLDWTVDEGTTLLPKQSIGEIESKKAESSLYTPFSGFLTTFNPKLLKDPSYINVSPYADGWLFEIEGEGVELLSPPAYLEHLQAVWDITQRTIKGQLNE